MITRTSRVEEMKNAHLRHEKKYPLNCFFEPSGKNGLKTAIHYESPCECKRNFENGERSAQPRSVPGMSQLAK